MNRTQEINRVYRLDFNNGEAEWDDPMPPEITAQLLGQSATSLINRTSLLAWALMGLREVEVADLAFDGWMKVNVITDTAFDEIAFTSNVAAVVARVKQVPKHQEQRPLPRQRTLGSVLSPAASFPPARAFA
jgi:hypothetical protein